MLPTARHAENGYLSAWNDEAMDRFPASLPRRMFWSRDVGGLSRCPECGGTLANESHTYVMAVRHQGKTERFMVGNDKGYFCERCPVVVLDYDTFAEFTRLGLGQAAPAEFAVLNRNS